MAKTFKFLLNIIVEVHYKKLFLKEFTPCKNYWVFWNYLILILLSPRLHLPSVSPLLSMKCKLLIIFAKTMLSVIVFLPGL